MIPFPARIAPPLGAFAALALLSTSCMKKEEGTKKAPESGVESMRIPEELLEPREVTVPHCTKQGETVAIDYKRMKRGGDDVGLAFPLALCLNGLESKTKNQVASVHFFVDLTFPSDIGPLAENIGRLSAMVLGSQQVRTIVTNPKGEQGGLEYFVNPLISFNHAKGVCQLRVSRLALNLKDVKVKDLPVGPRWLPRGVADGLASMGLNLVGVLDEWNIIDGRIVPILNGALEGALAGFGCDPSKSRVYTWTQDFAADTGGGAWYPATPVTPAAGAGAPGNGSTTGVDEASGGAGRGGTESSERAR